jgi:hypothetical protein
MSIIIEKPRVISLVRCQGEGKESSLKGRKKRGKESRGEERRDQEICA